MYQQLRRVIIIGLATAALVILVACMVVLFQISSQTVGVAATALSFMFGVILNIFIEYRSRQKALNKLKAEHQYLIELTDYETEGALREYHSSKNTA